MIRGPFHHVFLKPFFFVAVTTFMSSRSGSEKHPSAAIVRGAQRDQNLYCSLVMMSRPISGVPMKVMRLLSARLVPETASVTS